MIFRSPFPDITIPDLRSPHSSCSTPNGWRTSRRSSTGPPVGR